jgi:hypothetical protein
VSMKLLLLPKRCGGLVQVFILSMTFQPAMLSPILGRSYPAI